MAEHRFHLGDKVLLSRGFPYRAASRGDYEVVRQLPNSHGEFQYRIKSAEESYERVATESELVAS
jgi:hypothetical protein